MLRIAYLGCLALLLGAGCKDWTRVPPPPVSLSALESAAVPTDLDFPTSPSLSRVRLLRAVAPGALATLHVPDMAGTQERFRDTTLAQLLRSPQLRDALAQAGLNVDQLASFSVTPGAAPGGMNFSQLKKSLQGELVLSLEDVEFPEDAPQPTVKLLGAVSVAGAEHETQQLLDFAVMALGNSPKVQVEQGSLLGAAYTRFRVAGPPAIMVETALYRDALLIGVGRDVVTEAVRRLHDDALEALPDDASFGRCMQRVGDAHDVFRLHIDLAGILTRFRERIPADVKPALDFLGIQHMKALAVALAIRGKDLETKTFLDSPGGKDLFTDLLRRHAADRSLLERIPSTATSFSLFTIDGRVILERLRDSLKDEDRQELEDGLADLKAQGFDLEDEILRAFGPRFALVTVRAGRRDAQGIEALWNQLLGTAFLVEIRDAERAHAQLAKLPKSSMDVHRTDEEIGDRKVVVYRFPRERLPRGFAIVVAPVGAQLLVAFSRETMEQMLARPTPETLNHYREVVRGIPETAVALSYDDLSQSSSFLAYAFTAGLRQAQAQSGASPEEIQDATFPRLADFGANPSVSYTLADEHGVFTTTRSPTGGLTEVGGLGGVIASASIVLPTLAQERVRANEEEAIRSIEEIRGALGEYRSTLVRDADADGEGEYAFLSDLLGDEHAREGAASARPLLRDFERTPLGYKRAGYYFRIYLPAEDGSPIGEHEPTARRAKADGDLAENIFVLVAWPTHVGITGRRSFLLDGRNRIYFADAGYGDDNAPPPDLMTTQQGNLAAKPIDKHDRARDGHRWMEHR